jgi:hypothetical protein
MVGVDVPERRARGHVGDDGERQIVKPDVLALRGAARVRFRQDVPGAGSLTNSVVPAGVMFMVVWTDSRSSAS